MKIAIMKKALSIVGRAYSGSGVVTRIIAGLIIGIILGVSVPGIAVIELPGVIFVSALKAIAPLLVFVLVIASLANNSAKLDGRFHFVVFQYILATFIAASVAVAASFLFPSVIDLPLKGAESNVVPAGIGSVIENVLVGMFSNPIGSIVDANYIGVLFWAVVFGIIMKKCASDSTKAMFADLAEVLSGAVRFIIGLAGFGVMGLIYKSISSNGLSIFKDYGHIILVLVLCMLFVAFVANAILVATVLRRNPYPLILKCLKESGITAFFTLSSAANIPVNLELCKKLKLDRDFYSVSIPLGATINMSGAAVTITVLTLAATNTLGIKVDVLSAMVLSLIATVASCGASGVAGGSLLLIPLACSMFGIDQNTSMQVVGVGFIIGVVQDSFETALNSSSDALFTAVAEYRHFLKTGREIPDVP